MQSCGMQHENEVPTQHHGNVIVFVWTYKMKCKCMRIFLFFATRKITEKVELTKNATGKTSAIFFRRYDNCLDTTNLYSGTIKPVPKTCVF